MNAAMTTTTASKRPDTLVYGLGNTGLSVARFLRKQNVEALYADSRSEPPGLAELSDIDPGATVVVGRLHAELLDGVSTIVASPGISESDDFLRAARAARVAVISDIELFTRAARADFVAVTGSNGKSTVTTLIAHMCRACGLDVAAGANLGKPALDLLAAETPDFYVLELSSFQLQRTDYLPAKVAVLLNVSPDHLDWHATESEYVSAKLRIYQQARAAVYNRQDPVAADGLPEGVPAVSFGLDAPGVEHFGVLEVGSAKHLARGREALIATEELALVGEHNHANALAALAAVALLTDDLSPALDVLREFAGLPHRMQRVARHRGVTYVDDSKATNVAAAIASVRSLDTPVVLLAGGQGKGGDFAKLARDTAGRLRAAIVFGEDADKLKVAFGGQDVHQVADLQSAVSMSSEIARSGDTVLLAPACASFDQFDNYGQRGDVFAELARALRR